MEDLITFFRRIGELKTLKRTGWTHRNVPNSESVADHSFRTIVMAFLLAPRVGIDQNKAVKLALVHDLAETLVGDITPIDHVPKEEKHDREKAAMIELSTLNGSQELLSLWLEFEEGTTKEAIFVQQLDKFETLFQVAEYQEKYRDIKLDDFIPDNEKQVQHPLLRKLLKMIRETTKM
ncbi:MAG: HD domain-containing protein [Nanoarchaeota archaeon]|nr:HD domain-containing protein [Nanoarchaeota archaeon]